MTGLLFPVGNPPTSRHLPASPRSLQTPAYSAGSSSSGPMRARLESSVRSGIAICEVWVLPSSSHGTDARGTPLRVPQNGDGGQPTPRQDAEHQARSHQESLRRAPGLPSTPSVSAAWPCVVVKRQAGKSIFLGHGLPLSVRVRFGAGTCRLAGGPVAILAIQDLHSAGDHWAKESRNLTGLQAMGRSGSARHCGQDDLPGCRSSVGPRKELPAYGLHRVATVLRGTRARPCGSPGSGRRPPARPAFPGRTRRCFHGRCGRASEGRAGG